MIVSTLGWIGAALSLVAYYAVSRKLIAPDSLKYQSMTMGGAVLLMLACAWTSAWPSFLTNLVFLLVGIRIVLGTKREFMKSMFRNVSDRFVPSCTSVGTFSGNNGFNTGALTAGVAQTGREFEARRIRAGINCSALGSVNGATVVNVLPASITTNAALARF